MGKIDCIVIKRNGDQVKFNSEKILSVLKKVLNCGDFLSAPDDLDDVIADITDNINLRKQITTTEINDVVEQSLMKNGFFDEAKSFILYREQNKFIETVSVDKDAMSEYIFMSRYSRYLPRRNRRETWNEAVDRVMDMHIKRYPDISKDIAWAFQQVRDMRVLPSMRSMQFGGKPIEDKNSRLYNCTYSVADRTEFFPQTMYLLLTGCGVGFSVEFENINKLPELIKPLMTEIVFHKIEDSIEGWGDAIKILIDSYVKGYTVEFEYRKIRNQGEKIKSGGKAPGHVPLRRSIEKCRTILDSVVKRKSKKLKPIEVYDMVMHISDAVLAGGVRRSATICLFSPEDDEMMNSKTGNWIEDNPQRARSNNSVKLIREKTSREQFQRIFDKQKEFGEPGFYFAGDLKHGTNPCVEIGLNPHMPDTNETGFQMCNLTTINGEKLKTLEDFKIGVKAATIIGTCQAGFTKFPYLGETSELLCERESLLGVSITGIMDSPDIALNADYQKEMALYAVKVNKQFAKKIGIAQAARVTCVKPEGSSSLLLQTASGIHPRFAKKYFRRVQATKNDPVYKHFKENNPEACESSVWSANQTDDVITFCVESPEGAITAEEVSALDLLKIVKHTQQNWVLPGTARPESSPGLYHNVSNTISVKEHEWDEVADFIYENRKFFTGIALLAADGGGYAQAPHEQISTRDDEIAFSSLMEEYQKVDYTALNEEEDNTVLKSIIACAGGKCEL